MGEPKEDFEMDLDSILKSLVLVAKESQRKQKVLLLVKAIRKREREVSPLVVVPKVSMITAKKTMREKKVKTKKIMMKTTVQAKEYSILVSPVT